MKISEDALKAIGNRWWSVEALAGGRFLGEVAPWSVNLSKASRATADAPEAALLAALEICKLEHAEAERRDFHLRGAA